MVAFILSEAGSLRGLGRGVTWSLPVLQKEQSGCCVENRLRKQESNHLGGTAATQGRAMVMTQRGVCDGSGEKSEAWHSEDRTHRTCCQVECGYERQEKLKTTQDFRLEEAVISEMVKAWVEQVWGRSGVRLGNVRSLLDAQEKMFVYQLLIFKVSPAFSRVTGPPGTLVEWKNRKLFRY